MGKGSVVLLRFRPLLISSIDPIFYLWHARSKHLQAWTESGQVPERSEVVAPLVTEPMMTGMSATNW